MIKITFPDGSVREFAKGTTAFQIAESISPRLAADSQPVLGMCGPRQRSVNAPLV